MSPQIQFGLELTIRRADPYSTAKLRCTFLTLRSLDVRGDVSATFSASQQALQITTIALPV
jgi:hypothetical protein